jgi:hypothetical protein
MLKTYRTVYLVLIFYILFIVIRGYIAFFSIVPIIESKYGGFYLFLGQSYWIDFIILLLLILYAENRRFEKFLFFVMVFNIFSYGLKLLFKGF